MKSFIKKIIYISFAAILILSVSTSFASDYEDVLRVGIYYGDTAVKDLKLTSDSGFSIGIFKNREFIPVKEWSGDTLFAEFDKIDGVNSYRVDYGEYADIEELLNALENLEELGMEVFPACINSSYHILGGTFKNENDALWAAENLEVKGTALQMSEKAIAIKDDTPKVLFVVDDPELGPTVYGGDLEDTDEILTISGSAKGTYRGGFEVRTLDGGNTLTVVNTVAVESYLYSVVCREMSPSWEVEALKAQTVCARNFALGRINYHKKYGFDVCRTVCCQAYSSTADNSVNVHKAVDETYGELLFYEDKLVQAVYSSSMGAYTESVENVWGTKYPYLVSVENPYEDTENIYNGKWTKTLTRQRATEIMNSKGYNIGDITEIKVVENTPSGGVLKLLVKGTGGSKTFERESCRNVFSEATYSQRYTVTVGGMTIKPVLYVATGSKTSSLTLDSVSVITGTNLVSTVNDSVSVTNGKQKKEYKSTKTEGDKNTFVFSGEGWGHGVGMSQYGAKGMAEAGFTYDEILTHYYTGTHLSKAY